MLHVHEEPVVPLPSGRLRRLFRVSEYAPTRARAVEGALKRLARALPNVFGDLAEAVPSLRDAAGPPPLPYHATFARKPLARFTCPRLGEHRQLWLDGRSGRTSPWIIWAVVDEDAALLDVELQAHTPSVTRRGHVVRWWTGAVSTSDPVLAFRSLMPRLVADDSSWGAIADGDFSAKETDAREVIRALAAGAVPRRHTPEILQPLLDEHHAVFERRVEHGWPSQHVRSIFAVQRDATLRLLALSTRAAEDVPRRSAIGWSLEDDRAGVRQWVDARHWRRPRWQIWDPSARHLAYQQVAWLSADAPGRDVVLPDARVLPPAGEHRAFYEPYRVEVAPGAELELAHRAAVIAAAEAERKTEGSTDPMDRTRLEGIRVPWRHFRAAYDHAAANPVYSGDPYRPGGRRWSDDRYPRPRKPSVVFRWSGAWNPSWRFGYEFWGCHVWSIEWLRGQDAPRRIDVVIDVQTD